MKHIENVNQRRLQLAAKGYLTTTDLETYCQCSYGKAKKVYEIISSQVEAEGKVVSIFGITPERVNAYMGLTEKKIRAYAEQGL